MSAGLLVFGALLAVLGANCKPLTVAAVCSQALGVALLAVDLHRAFL